MNAKWYFSTLIILLTLLGSVANQEQACVPNQEIVLQFTNDEVSLDESQNAIAIVKKQLHRLGIDDIQVGDLENGALTIAYHSSIDVESIKKSLLENNISVGATIDKDQKDQQSPLKDNTKNYNLDIYEIHKNTDNSQGSAGKYVLVIKQDYDRYTNLNFFSNVQEINVSETNNLVKQAFKIQGSVAIAIDHTSYAIPEVRAGPVI
jgi:hypothetical protein